MWPRAEGTRTFSKNGKGSCALLLCPRWLLHGLASSHLKRAGAFIRISLKVVEIHVFVVNSLYDMYAKYGSMMDALRIFNKMPSRNLVTWIVVILRNVKCGKGQ